MKNRKWLLILIAFISFFTYFDICFADEEVHYYNIDKVSNYEYEGVTFSNIKFHNNMATTTKSFGLTMDVKNNLDEDKNFVVEVVYFDEDYNPIAVFERDNNILSGEEYTYIHMASNFLITSSYTPFDIKYYSIKVTLNDYYDYVEISDNSNLDYYLDKYYVDIKVEDNNIFHIKEKINAYFNIEKHGIIRNIPFKNEVKGYNTSNINYAHLSNLDVDSPYTLSNNADVYSVKIGSASDYILGDKEYNISYDYYIGKDPNENYDEFYFNIIGTSWDTKSNYVTFKITMPKEFDPSLLGFSSGTEGKVENDYVHFKIKGNVIEGYLTEELSPYEGLTIRLELPEGYFVKENITLYEKLLSIVYLFIFIPPILIIPVYNFWKKHGKDDPIIETVEFYPPENLNSLDIAYIYNNCFIGMQDILSMIVYLASKGYIKIIDNGVGGDFRHSFTFIKLKEYDGSNICEKRLFDGLFTSDEGEILSANNSSLLGEKFSDAITDITRIVHTDINEKQYRYVRNSGFGCWISLVTVLAIIMMSIPAFLLQGVMTGFLTLLVAIFVTMGLSNLIRKNTIVGIIFLIMGLAWSFELVVRPLMFNEPAYFIGLVACVIICSLMNSMSVTLDKRTKRGTEILGRVLGFKNFLEVAEKAQLEALVEKNPNYFYDILPYTYVLDVSKTWISKFEDILITKPEWFESSNDFDLSSFSNSMDETFSSVRSSYNTYNTPSSSGSDWGDSDWGSSSSSSSSSGGGSSGGGSGGGGGSSW